MTEAAVIGSEFKYSVKQSFTAVGNESFVFCGVYAERAKSNDDLRDAFGILCVP